MNRGFPSTSLVLGVRIQSSALWTVNPPNDTARLSSERLELRVKRLRMVTSYKLTFTTTGGCEVGSSHKALFRLNDKNDI